MVSLVCMIQLPDPAHEQSHYSRDKMDGVNKRPGFASGSVICLVADKIRLINPNSGHKTPDLGAELGGQPLSGWQTPPANGHQPKSSLSGGQRRSESETAAATVETTRVRVAGDQGTSWQGDEEADFGHRKGGALAPPPECSLVFSIIYPEGAGAAGLKPRPSDARNRLFRHLDRETGVGTNSSPARKRRPAALPALVPQLPGVAGVPGTAAFDVGGLSL